MIECCDGPPPVACFFIFKPPINGAPQVANDFVSQFYEILHSRPNNLHRFYSKDSVLTHIDVTHTNEGLTPTCKVAIGEDKIKDIISDLKYDKAVSEIFSVAAQYTLLEGVVVQVFGCLQAHTGLGHSKRLFAQTFFLAVQEGGYYVRNDIFRYLFPDERDEGAEGELSEGNRPTETNTNEEEQVEAPVVVQNQNVFGIDRDGKKKEEGNVTADGEVGKLDISGRPPKEEMAAGQPENEDKNHMMPDEAEDVKPRSMAPPPPSDLPPMQSGGTAIPVVALPPITTGPAGSSPQIPPVNGSGFVNQQNQKRPYNQQSFQAKATFFPYPTKPSVTTTPQSDSTTADSPSSSNGVGPPPTGNRLGAPEAGVYPAVGGRGPTTPHRTGGPGSSSSEGRRPPPPPSSLASSEGRAPGMEAPLSADAGGVGVGIFIREIPSTISADDLKKALEAFGPIKPGGLTLKIQKQRDSYAFVDFQTVEAATACLEEGLVLDGKKVSVEPKKPYIFKPSWGGQRPMGIPMPPQDHRQHRGFGGIPISDTMNGSGQRWQMPVRPRMLAQPPPPPQGQAMMHGPYGQPGQPGPYMTAYPSTLPPHMVPMMTMVPSGSSPHHPHMTLDPATGYFMPVGMTGMGNMVQSPPGMVGLPVNNPLNLSSGHVSSVRSNSRQRGRGGRGGTPMHPPPPPPLAQPPPPPGGPLSRSSSAS